MKNNSIKSQDSFYFPNAMVVLNWNVAGVNTNAFEYLQSAKVKSPDETAYSVAETDDSSDFISQLSTDLDLFFSACDPHVRDDFEGDNAETETKKGDLLVAAKEWANHVKYTQVMTEKFLFGDLVKFLETDFGKDCITNAISNYCYRRITKEFSEGTYSDTMGDYIEKLKTSGIFSKPDRDLKDRKWAFTNLTPQNCSHYWHKMTKLGTPEGRLDMWYNWFTDIGRTIVGKQCKDSATTDEKRDMLTEKIIHMALFDSFICWCVYQLYETKYKQEKDSTRHLSNFIRKMTVEPNDKAVFVFDCLRSALEAYKPDFMGIQEFNELWYDMDKMKGSENKKQLHKDYYEFRPKHVKNIQQETLLFINKHAFKNGFRKNKKKLIEDDNFDGFDLDLEEYLGDEGVKAFAKKMQKVYADKMSTVAVVPTEEVTIEFLQQKMAACLLDKGKNTERKLLVCCLHADSDGTDNCAMVTCCVELAKELGARLIIMMDANCKETYPEKKKKLGAANEMEFFQYCTKTMNMRTCWDSVVQEDEHGKQFFEGKTTRKTRSYIQAQWKKARVVDNSVKDYVMSSSDYTELDGVPIHNFHNLALEEVLDNAGRSGTFSIKSFPTKNMPNMDIPSDHCMVIAKCYLSMDADLLEGGASSSTGNNDSKACAIQ